MTWSHNRDPDLFWPLKFLPFEPDIEEARILTFGYNANFRPGSGKKKLSILDFAKDLLYDLKYSQDESGPGLEDLRMGEVSDEPQLQVARPSRCITDTDIPLATHHIYRPFYGRAGCEGGTLDVLKLVHRVAI